MVIEDPIALTSPSFQQFGLILHGQFYFHNELEIKKMGKHFK